MLWIDHRTVSSSASFLSSHRIVIFGFGCSSRRSQKWKFFVQREQNYLRCGVLVAGPSPQTGQLLLLSSYNIKCNGRAHLNEYWVIIWKEAVVVSCNYCPRIQLQRHLSPWNRILLENLIVDLSVKFSSPFSVHKSLCKLNPFNPVLVFKIHFNVISHPTTRQSG